MSGEREREKDRDGKTVSGSMSKKGWYEGKSCKRESFRKIRLDTAFNLKSKTTCCIWWEKRRIDDDNYTTRVSMFMRV